MPNFASLFQGLQRQTSMHVSHWAMAHLNVTCCMIHSREQPKGIMYAHVQPTSSRHKPAARAPESHGLSLKAGMQIGP